MYLNFCNPFLAASLLLTASSLSTFSMIVDVHCDTLTCTNGWFSSKLLHTCERGGATTAQRLFLYSQRRWASCCASRRLKWAASRPLDRAHLCADRLDGRTIELAILTLILHGRCGSVCGQARRANGER